MPTSMTVSAISSKTSDTTRPPFKFEFVTLARERLRRPCVKGAVKNLLIFD